MAHVPDRVLEVGIPRGGVAEKIESEDMPVQLVQWADATPRGGALAVAAEVTSDIALTITGGLACAVHDVFANALHGNDKAAAGILTSLSILGGKLGINRAGRLALGGVAAGLTWRFTADMRKNIAETYHGLVSEFFGEYDFKVDEKEEALIK